MKIDPDKTIQYESSFVTRAPFSIGNHWLLHLLTYKGEHARMLSYNAIRNNEIFFFHFDIFYFIFRWHSRCEIK